MIVLHGQFGHQCDEAPHRTDWEDIMSRAARCPNVAACYEKMSPTPDRMCFWPREMRENFVDSAPVSIVLSVVPALWGQR